MRALKAAGPHRKLRNALPALRGCPMGTTGETISKPLISKATRP